MVFSALSEAFSVSFNLWSAIRYIVGQFRRHCYADQGGWLLLLAVLPN